MTSIAPATATRAPPSVRVSQRVGAQLVALAAPVTVGLAAADHGGYGATSWGWLTLAFLWAAGLSLGLRADIRLSRAELGMLAAISLLAGWIALSAAWAPAAGTSIEELERALIYPAALLTILLLTRRRTVAHLLGGLLAAIVVVCAYALATRLLPDRISSSTDSIAAYRLSEPAGYWNALGILSSLGALVAVGFAVRGRSLAARIAAAAALPLLVLTLYFTFSRGGWAALAVGLAVAIALDSRRLELLGSLLVLAPVPIVLVWLASRATSLATVGSSLQRATSDGHRVAVALAGLAVANALAALALTAIASRWQPGALVRRSFAVSLAVIALGGVAGAVAANGGPATLARKGYDSFTAPLVHGPVIGNRVFSLSSNGRIDLWWAAWHDFEAHPLAGSGAGSYEAYWYAHRPSVVNVRDAHSLYLETTAELGAVGLALLVLALALPFAGLRRNRAGLAPFALAAYAAFLFHAGIDWDWEMPAVTLAGLACGAAVLVGARAGARPMQVRLRFRLVAATPIVLATAFALTSLVGNRAVSASQAAASAGSWQEAERQADTAVRWLPWSADALGLVGDARFGEGRFAAAAVSYRQAIARDPRNWLLWFHLGFATSGSESRAAFAEARRLDPLNDQIPRPRA